MLLGPFERAIVLGNWLLFSCISLHEVMRKLSPPLQNLASYVPVAVSNILFPIFLNQLYLPIFFNQSNENMEKHSPRFNGVILFVSEKPVEGCHKTFISNFSKTIHRCIFNLWILYIFVMSGNETGFLVISVGDWELFSLNIWHALRYSSV